MKTPRQYISEIRPDEMNFKHIATSGKINATLLIDIERVMEEYAKHCVEAEHERMAELLKETVEALQLARNILHQKYNYTALEYFDNIIEKAKGKSQ